jgi:2-keto-3-deoxy-galactonokinase
MHRKLGLYSQTGTWEAAVGRYHSATAGLGDSYRAAVMSRWLGRGNPDPRVVSVARAGVELAAGVIVQRPMAVSGPIAASGSIGAMPGWANLPHVIMPGSGFARRM